MREIVLDTETTGLEWATGDRLCEIGCVELNNHLPTGRSFQVYLNPERPMSERASEINGLTDAFLADKARFAEVADPFLTFLGDSPLIIHNASFDLGFINFELERIGRAALPSERVIDTLLIARRKFPGAPVSIDALCRRFGISLDGRVKHGALLDARLLADVYLELIGGRQTTLRLASHNDAIGPLSVRHDRRPPRPARLPGLLTQAEAAAHAAFVKTLGPEALWLAMSGDGAGDPPSG